MAKNPKEQEIKKLLQNYFQAWEQLLYHEKLLNVANDRWMEAKSGLFEKRSREHCETVLDFLQKKIAESEKEKYRILEQDVKFWIDADLGRKMLRYV